MSVADSDPASLTIARDIIQGNKLIKEKAVKSISQSEVKLEFQNYVGNAIDDAEFSRSVQQAILADYTARKHNANEDTSILDSGDFQESVERVLGKAFEFNDRKVIGFKNAQGEQIDDDDFEDVVDSLSVESISADRDWETDS